jgi:hypothetical protein
MRMRFETLISAYYKVSPFVILFGEFDLARYVQFWMLIPFAINGVFLWVSWNQQIGRRQHLGYWAFLLNKQHTSEYFALSAYFHLLSPVLMCPTLTDCPVNEPAETPRLEFPCRTLFPSLRGTLPYRPARPVLLIKGFL